MYEWGKCTWFKIQGFCEKKGTLGLKSKVLAIKEAIGLNSKALGLKSKFSDKKRHLG